MPKMLDVKALPLQAGGGLMLRCILDTGLFECSLLCRVLPRCTYKQ